MQSIIFTTETLEQIISEIVQKPLGRIGFCEELEVDFIEWADETIYQFEEIIPFLNERFNVSITSYEITENTETKVVFIFHF